MSSLAILARRASLVAIKQRSAGVICTTSFKALASQVARLHKTRMFATFRRDEASQVARLHNKTRMFATLRRDEDESDVDYNDYECHRFRKDLAQMHRATDSIQHSLDQLKETSARHLKIVEAGGMPASNLNALLKTASEQEAVLSNQLEILRGSMMDARRAVFAVDAPDGTPDFELSKNQSEVKQIIDFAAEHEDVDKVIRSHQKDRKDHARAMKTFAVDAPDGMSDDEMRVEMKYVDDIIEYAAEHENVKDVNKRHTAESAEHDQDLKVLAVDAPDGTSDDEFKVDMEAVDRIIYVAADNEDTAEVLKRHKEEEEEHAQDLKIFAVDAPDGFSDDEAMVEMEAVEHIIDVAAESEDAVKVLKRHREEADERARGLKTIAVDAPDGISDDEMWVDMEAVDNIIDFAAEHEDVAKVNKQHEQDEEARAQNLRVLAVDAPDGMSDDEFKIDLEAVQNIIDFAAEHEDADAIVLKHKRERQEHIARMNRIRDENYW
jgi:hypothetical protein